MIQIGTFMHKPSSVKQQIKYKMLSLNFCAENEDKTMQFASLSDLEKHPQ